MSEEKKSGNTGANTRWWESYLVRYFSGAIVGSICLMVIIIYADWRIFDGVNTKLPVIDKDFPFAAIGFLLIAGGLVYSYIVSSPITVIHFGRSGRSPLEQHVRYFWFGWVIALCAIQLSAAVGSSIIQVGNFGSSVLMLLVCLGYLIVSHHINKVPRKIIGIPSERRRIKIQRESWRNIWRSLGWAGLLIVFLTVTAKILSLEERPLAISLLAFALPTIFVGLVQYMTLLRIFHTERAVHRFYRILSRARNIEGSKDIRETYTHLREHSNATFIVLLELCFSAFVVFLVELYAVQPRAVPATILSLEVGRMASAILLLVALWMVPNLFMWSRANQIERDFARRPKLYTSNSKASRKRRG